MRSSTFSSDLGGPNRAIAVLIALLLLYLAALEFGTRWALPRISAGRHRQTVDGDAARQIGPGAPAGARSVLMVGNSLLEAGISRPEFRTALAPQFTAVVFPVEGTTYWDWYFGLRRLFAEGARPQQVVVTMNVKQLLSNATNGEQFARSMLRVTDLHQLSRAVHLDPMTASNYFFATGSEWIGARASIRNALLERWLPDAPLLVAHFPSGNPAAPSRDVDIEAALERVRGLRELCAAHGAGFAWLVPPSLNPADAAPQVAAAARRAGFTVLLPYPPATLAATDFSDGFHLSAAGAARFTAAAAVELRRTLNAPGATVH